ncbi:hypothetical protein HDU83_004190 [Entophlyctis luteolus]|nr:hypothetical protein HDU82_006927 [Entophlyctis luteolus]KAJ3355019.1 hypothetical protein HDU83_004190 [Entophlyctis luteolus]
MKVAILASVVAAVSALKYLGVSESCLEFGTNIPGVYNTDYTSPNPAAMTYANGQFANLFRLPFMWERLQPSLNSSFNSAYLGYIDAAVQTATNLGAVIVLDPHNYARYGGSVIGAGTVTAANLANLWTQLATKYKSNSLVWFGIMNEPNGIDATVWFSAAQVAINAIRATGATNVITVPGNCWTGAHSWVSGSCDSTSTANAVAALAITDPANNYVFEMHQYFDSDFSGTAAACTWDYNQLTAATSWLRTNGKKGYLGEFAGAPNSGCETVITGVLQYLNSNSDVWVAASWWAAGPWWGTNMYSIETTAGVTSPDAVMIPILEAYKPGATIPSTTAAAATTTAAKTTTTTTTSTTTTSTTTTTTAARTSTTTATTGTAAAKSSTTAGSSSCSALYGQCGGVNWTGPTCCASGTCHFSNAWYSQCY